MRQDARPFPVWIDKSHCSIDAFRACVDNETTPGSVPLATDILANVPVYDGEQIRLALDDKPQLSAYMAEWNRVFGDGAGIALFRNTFHDDSILDQVVEILCAIADSEASELAGSGDHFAAAGSNTRIWNAHEKLCLANPAAFIRYNANPIVPLASCSWLGPYYQITTQVNIVHPGSPAQVPHRDYHMGFQPIEVLEKYPAHVHRMSAALTLQGAIAHCDMPIESGPTRLLPFSQTYLPGYLAISMPEFQKYFAEHFVQLPLEKGDAVFFNPAVFHAAGENNTQNQQRFALLLQIGSGFGRSIEIVDRARITAATYPTLLEWMQSGDLSEWEVDNVVAACAEGYPFPANLDFDSPLGGMAPPSQQDLLYQALRESWSYSALVEALDEQVARKRSH